MDTLLNNPAVQAGVIPFVVALIVVLALRPVGRFAVGLAVMAGFLTAVALTAGFTFPPKTSTHKIVLLALASVPAAALLHLRPVAWRIFAPIMIAAGAAAVLWVVWPVISRREGMEFWLLTLGAGVYGAWMTASVDSLYHHPGRALTASLALGFGTGIAALLGASALLGQLGIALGAATGAVALLHLFTQSETAGRMLTFPIGVLTGVLGVAAMVYAKLPWFVLPILGLIPLLAHTPLSSKLSPWMQFVLLGIITLAGAAAAVFVTRYVAGGVPM